MSSNSKTTPESDPLQGLSKFAGGDHDPECDRALDDPQAWFARLYPQANQKRGRALQIKTGPTLTQRVVELSDSFFAAALAEPSIDSMPFIYLANEGSFVRFEQDAESPHHGTYRTVDDREVEAVLVEILQQFLDQCKTDVNVENVRFRLSSHRRIRSIIERAKALLREESFVGSIDGFACANGFFSFRSRSLQPFAPNLRLRIKSPAPFAATAECPRFVSFLRQVLSEEDISLLQRWAGLVLTGRNTAQAIMILCGASGAGKGTFLRILSYILGVGKTTELRTMQLEDRFEMGLIAKATLLVGADVPRDFLRRDGARRLKALTGGDLISLERKNSNTCSQISGEFNVAVSCNELPSLPLENDAEAWRRRLRIIDFKRRDIASTVVDFDAVLLVDEASGILNWFLEGQRRLVEENGTLRQTVNQRARVDKLVDGSAPIGTFLRTGIERAPGQWMTSAAVFSAYQQFCRERGLPSAKHRVFGAECKEFVRSHFGESQRNDSPRGRGWRGLKLISHSDSDTSDTFFPVPTTIKNEK